jgi:HEPN domain-containing protein
MMRSDMHAVVMRNAAYHLGQAAEKALKAVFVSEGIRPGAGHQIDLFARKQS